MRNRSVLELMVMAFTGLVVIAILTMGATIAVIEIRDPTVDTSAAGNALLSVITAILGALLGILAGRSTAFQKELSDHHDDDEPEPDG